jgi:hypothetical protein
MILLNKAYGGYLAGTIAQFPTSVEAALIAQGLATLSAGPVTPGNVNAGNQQQGRAGIAAGGTSVVITNGLIQTESKVYAYLSNAAADTTALYITRIQCTSNPGAITITLNAAATAAVSVDWFILGPGLSPTN